MVSNPPPTDASAWAGDLPEMAGPAEYRICLSGHLDPDESSRLCGLSISSGRGEHGGRVTTLQGVLADQAALAGVLNTLYTYQFPILSVECLGARAN